MVVLALRLRDFRSYARADVTLGPRLTVVHGRNGAGKTNLLEALYFGCTGRSCRTSNEREVVRFEAAMTRVDEPERCKRRELVTDTLPDGRFLDIDSRRHSRQSEAARCRRPS